MAARAPWGRWRRCTSSSRPIAQTLLDRALRALGVALSVMTKQQQQQLASASSPPGSAAAAARSKETPTSMARRGKRTRSSDEVNSRVTLTTAPCEDGYMWRNYGEKKIQDSHFTRCYFRCTYKNETGCMATKRVQQKDNGDPPIFLVTHHNEHTCNSIATAANRNNNVPSLQHCNNSVEGVIIPTNNGYAKIEQQQTLPPLAEVSVQEPFSVSTDHHLVSPRHARALLRTGTADGSSNISGVPCNAYLDVGPLTPSMEQRGDDPSYNLERFLLHDSSEYY